MSTAQINGSEYFYEDRGEGPPVVLVHGTTGSHDLWDDQVASLSRKYRCIAVDCLGHGHSSAASSEYTMDQEAEHLHQFVRKVAGQPAHLIGLSSGGMIGMRLALSHPEALLSLALVGTSAEAEDPQRVAAYRAMAETAREQGLDTVVDAVVGILFTEAFIGRQAPALEVYRRSFLALDRDGIYWAVLSDIQRRSILDEIAGIRAPTLVLVGEADTVTPPDHAERMVERIPDSRLERIPGVGHMIPWEASERTTQLLSEFLAEVSRAEDTAGRR